LTKKSSYAIIVAVIIELDAHPEGWRDRPGETPATSWKVDLQHGANSGRCSGANERRGSLKDESDR